MSQKAVAGASEFKSMVAILDRLPPAASSEFASLVTAALRQPTQPPPPQLTPMQLELVKLNMQHYMATQPESVRDRFASYYRNGAKPESDACWIVGQSAQAILSGDDDLTSLGVRMFAANYSRQSQSPR